VENDAIEAIRLGKQLRFRPSALVRYLEERARNGNGRGSSWTLDREDALHAEAKLRYQR